MGNSQPRYSGVVFIVYHMVLGDQEKVPDVIFALFFRTNITTAEKSC